MLFRAALNAADGISKDGPRIGKHISRRKFPGAEPFRAAMGANSPL